MKCVIRIEGWATEVGIKSFFDGLYVVDFDFDSPVKSKFSRDVADAKVFENIFEAMEYRNTVSSVEPVRSTDGEPNRPLSAFHISVRSI